MGWVRASDTFVGDLDDGTPIPVKAGDVFQENHRLVLQMRKRDRSGADRLFAPLDTGEEEGPVRRPRLAKGSAS